MDAFVAKFTNPALITGTPMPTALQFFTYLGGSGDDVGTAIAVDATGGANVTGWTKSADFPAQNALPGTFGGGTDAFLAHIDTTGTGNTAQVDASSFLGGSGNDAGTSIALDPFGNVNLAGETASANFSTTTNAVQPALKGPSDIFVASLAPVINLGVTETVSPTPVGVGNQVGFSYTITNNGSDFVSGINFTDIFGNSNPTFASATAPGGCSSVVSAGTGGGSGTVTVTCAVGSLAPNTSALVTVNMTPNSAGTFSDNGTVSVFGRNQTFKPAAPPSASVNDFTLAVSPATATVVAGVPATFQIVVGANGPIPSAISLSCSSGLPNPGSCSFIGTNPISNINTGGQVSRSLVIDTTARVTTTSQLRKNRGTQIFYAASLPLCGLTFLGISLGDTKRRKRLMAVLLGAGFLVLIALQLGCGSKGTTTLTTGTPAGTYNITVSAISGSVTHTQVITLVVQ